MDQPNEKTPKEIYRHAMAVMHEAGVPLLPRNYEIFYAYAAGGNRVEAQSHPAAAQAEYAAPG